MTNIHTQNVAEARDLARQIRGSLAEMFDVLGHVDSTRNAAYLSSLREALRHVESASTHALQHAVRRVTT